MMCNQKLVKRNISILYNIVIKIKELFCVPAERMGNKKKMHPVVHFFIIISNLFKNHAPSGRTSLEICAPPTKLCAPGAGQL